MIIYDFLKKNLIGIWPNSIDISELIHIINIVNFFYLTITLTKYEASHLCDHNIFLIQNFHFLDSLWNMVRYIPQVGHSYTIIQEDYLLIKTRNSAAQVFKNWFYKFSNLSDTQLILTQYTALIFLTKSNKCIALCYFLVMNIFHFSWD